VDELQRRLSIAEPELARLEEERTHLTAEGEEGVGRLRLRIAELEAELERERRRSLAAEQTAGYLAERICSLDESAATLWSSLGALKQESVVVAAELCRVLRDRPCGGEAAACPRGELCGRCVLYVGGQPHLVGRYRELVERCGGVFEHHDGSEERRLGRMIGRASVVVCPVSCVSHDAVHRLKELCRRRRTPVMFLRSASVSSLTRSVQAHCLRALRERGEGRLVNEPEVRVS